MSHYETFLNELNGFGRYQKLRFSLICIAAILPPIVTYLHSFIAANPNHRCKNPFDSNDYFSANLSIYLNQSLILGKCNIMINGTKEKCTSWVFDKTYYKTTLTEDWSMVCDKAFWRARVQTIYFSGVLIGSLVLGVLSDRFGRRPMVLSSFVLLLLGSIGVAFGPQTVFGVLVSYIIYAICRFVIAAGTRGINNTAFILGIELVGESKRTFAGMVFQYIFPLGQIVLVFMAYLIRDWRTLAWVMSIPCVPFLFYYFFLPESPRWLIVKNKHKEARSVFENVSKINKKPFSHEKWNNFIKIENELNKESQISEVNETIITVFKSFKFSVISLILFLHWIVNNFVFYGVGLKSNDLGANPYLTFAISAFVELIAIILTHHILEKFGRKYPYGISLFIAGLACLSIVFIENTIAVITMAMVGKFFVSSSYAAIYVYSSEMFPTSVRNSLLGSCSMMARIGSMIAPLINGLGEDGWKKFPFLVFGISGIITGLTTFILPETKGMPLSKTINEAESRINIICAKNKKQQQKINPMQLEESNNVRI